MELAANENFCGIKLITEHTQLCNFAIEVVIALINIAKIPS